HLARRIEVHVSNYAVAALVGCVINTIDAHVDHHGSWLKHIAGDHLRPPDSSHNDVRAAEMRRQVPGATMAHRYGRIGSLALLHHDSRHRLAYDIASADDYALGSGGVNAGPHEELLYAGGRARDRK